MLTHLKLIDYMLKPFKNRNINRTLPVLLYRNLHIKGKQYSIKQNNLVVAHVSYPFYLKDCTFIVNKSGHNRYLKTGIRNVHAMIKGYISNDISLGFSFNLQYDLQKGEFTNSILGKVDKCKFVYLDNTGVKFII